jgi:hypothetical protein
VVLRPTDTLSGTIRQPGDPAGVLDLTVRDVD